MLTSCGVVRAKDFREPWFAERTRELAHSHTMHRKLWEFCVVAQVYKERIGSGGRVLGFGVGKEPMASWFAAQGAEVVATDRPDETAQWSATNQHAQSVEAIRYPDVCDPVTFGERVTFRPVDMNAIPEDLRCGQFDLTWSCGSFEHLGSRMHGMRFFLTQMGCLKPGGLAVHTTEYAYNQQCLDTEDLALYRERDLERLNMLVAQHGDVMWDLDLAPGSDPEDLHVDREPYGLPHLRIMVGPFATTSVLIVAERRPL